MPAQEDPTRLNIRVGTGGSYWKNLTLYDREMMALQVYPALLQSLSMPRKRGRAEAGEVDKIVDQVRLIEEGRVNSQPTPVRRCRVPESARIC